MDRQRKRKGRDWVGYDYEYGLVLSEHSVGYWEVQCKLCDDTHIMETRAIRNGARSKKCVAYRSHNWTGLDRWDAMIRRTYGITLEEYHTILKEQDYGCKLCGKSEEEEGRRLAIDHCHSSGKVRGILCSDCNIGLGKFKDNLEVLQKAIDYLEYANAR